MEKQIRDSLVSSKGSNALDLVHQYCRETVVEELWEMQYEIADVVFWAARQIKETDLVKIAAKNVLAAKNGYNNEVKKAASAFLNELSIQ